MPDHIRVYETSNDLGFSSREHLNQLLAIIKDYEKKTRFQKKKNAEKTDDEMAQRLTSE